MFKVLSQPDDFNDDLGLPLDALNLAAEDRSESGSNDLRDQFDEGNLIITKIGKKYVCVVCKLGTIIHRK